MTYVRESTVSSELQTAYQVIVTELEDLAELALALKRDQATPLLTPDLSDLRGQVQELADQLAASDAGHLVNSVGNIEAYLRDDPGAALHHIRELRRKLLFRRWPLARQLFAITRDLPKTEQLLETQSSEHIAAVIEDLQRSRHFQKFVPAEHQPGVAAFCIKEGILYGDEEEAALRGYFLARQTMAEIASTS